jgi:hypothetical protein
MWTRPMRGDSKPVRFIDHVWRQRCCSSRSAALALCADVRANLHDHPHILTMTASASSPANQSPSDYESAGVKRKP